MKILLTDTGYIDPSPIRDAGHDVVLFDEAAPVPVLNQIGRASCRERV